MPGADHAGGNTLLHCKRQVEQPERVADVRPGTTDLLGKLLMGRTEVVEQLLVGRGFFQRVQLLPVQVLHESVTEHGVVLSFADDGRDHREGRLAGTLASGAHP